MPFMRISQGQRYVKKGTPKEREQHYFRQLADDIFADMLPRTVRPGRRNAEFRPSDKDGEASPSGNRAC